MAEACERPILAFLQDCKHSLAIWDLKLGSLNWILIIHCTVWYQRKLTLLMSWEVQLVLQFSSKARRKSAVSFQKTVEHFAMKKKNKQPYNKSEWLELVISGFLQRKWQLGDRCVNSSAILLNTKHTPIWVCLWKSFSNPPPRRKWSH